MERKADFIRPENDIRELRFRPVDPAGGRVLDVEQLEHYNTHGFIGSLPALGADEIIRVNAYITDLIDKVVAAPDQRDSYSITAYHLVCAGLYDLATTPAVLNYVEDILGPDFVCWDTTIFCKLPGDIREVPLHQDAAYWPFTPTRTVTAWLSIDGAGTDNAAMEFVPGSHLLGAVDHEDLTTNQKLVTKRQVLDPESYSDRYVNTLYPGELSLHADLVLHGSPANLSTRRRTGVTLRYAAAEVRTLPGWEWWYGGGVHCRGTVPAPWPNRRRPNGERPDLMAAFPVKLPDSG